MLLMAVLGAAAIAGPPTAAALTPGNLILATVAQSGGQIIELDPESGAENLLEVGPPIYSPYGMAVTPGGAVVVADNAGGVYTVNPGGSVTGSPVSNFNPIGLDLAPDGRAIVADQGSHGPGPLRNGAIIAVDPATGAQTTIAAGGTAMPSPSGLQVTPTGHVYATDLINRGVFSSTLATGGLNVLASCCFGAPFGMDLTAQADPLVADYVTQAIVQVDAGTGKNTTIASVQGGQLASAPWWIARGADNTLYVLEHSISQAQGQVYALAPGSPEKQVTQGLLQIQAVAVVPPTCFGKFATIVGGPKRDKLVGTRFSDVIAAGSGDDQIKALGGNDLVCGGAGDDAVLGGSGSDRIKGQAGADQLGGGKGKDKLLGGKGRDRVGRS